MDYIDKILQPVSGQDYIDKILSKSNVQSAQSDIGDQNYYNQCEKWVEQQAYGKTGIYPTASDAWNDYSSKGLTSNDIQNAEPGQLIYFKPDNGNMGFGHAGVVTDNQNGDPSFVSATYGGVQKFKLSDWIKQTGQQVLGTVTPE